MPPSSPQWFPTSYSRPQIPPVISIAEGVRRDSSDCPSGIGKHHGEKVCCGVHCGTDELPPNVTSVASDSDVSSSTSPPLPSIPAASGIVPSAPAPTSTDSLSQSTTLSDPAATATSLLTPVPISSGDLSALSATPKETGSSIVSTSPGSAFSAATPTISASSSSSTSTALPQSEISTHRSQAGPIAGGIIGGVILLALLLSLFFLLRRRMVKNRTAPSAEFMNADTHYAPTAQYQTGASLLRVMSNESDEEAQQLPPPPFSRGNFADPVYEKLSAAAAQREMYQQPEPYTDSREGSPNMFAQAGGSTRLE